MEGKIGIFIVLVWVLAVMRGIVWLCDRFPSLSKSFSWWVIFPALLFGVPYTYGLYHYGYIFNGLTEAHMKDEPLEKLLPINMRPRVLAIGYDYSVGIKKDGTVWTWGVRWGDSLARPAKDGENAYEPGQVPGITDAVSAASDSDSVLVLRRNGLVWSWGGNRSGELGYLTEGKPQLEPRQIPELANIVDIATHSGVSCALKRDGTVWGWGDGTDGRLGADRRDKNQPVAMIPGLKNIVRVVPGYAIDKNGVLWSWGSNFTGRQTSPGDFESWRPAPVVLPRRVVDFALGVLGSARLALLEDGTVWSWGYSMEVGIGGMKEREFVLPHRIPTLSRVMAVAASSGGSVVTDSGRIAQWGVSAGAPPPPGPLPRHDLYVPYFLSGRYPAPVQYLVSGLGAYALIDAKGDVWYWKSNFFGQRGTGKAVSPPSVSYWLTPEKSHWKYD